MKRRKRTDFFLEKGSTGWALGIKKPYHGSFAFNDFFVTVMPLDFGGYDLPVVGGGWVDILRSEMVF